MTIHFYILPITQIGSARGPKYFKWQVGPDATGFTCPWSLVDYGSINEAVLAADISDADHATLAANADVYSFPVNLDTTITTTQRTALNIFIEAVGIPGDWITVGDTFRSILRTITSLMLYLQRVLALIGYPANPYAGITLNTQYRNIPNPLHDALQQGAISLGYTWTTANNDQVRKIFKTMADQWGSAVIHFGIATL